MKLIFIITSFFLLSLYLLAREVGETEITTEDGIEVFQNEKFYLLKKNVKILSDSFTLSADKVKIDFNKNLYDITELNAEGKVDFYSQDFNIFGNGHYLEFEIKVEKLKIEGVGSELTTGNIEFFSDDKR